MLLIESDHLSKKSRKKHNSTANKIIAISFDLSYSDELKEHLSNVNMEPWFYIYENYVRNKPKNDKSKSLG